MDCYFLLDLQGVYRLSTERSENGHGESGTEIFRGGREWKLTSPLHSDDLLVLCDKTEEGLRAMIEDKSKGMMLGGEEGTRGGGHCGLEAAALEAKYLGFVLDFEVQI